MTTVDFRTRLDGDVELLDPSEFLEVQVPALLEARGGPAGIAAIRLGLVPLTLDVEGFSMTLVPHDDRLEARPGGHDASDNDASDNDASDNDASDNDASDNAVVVALDRKAFSELMEDTASTFGLQMTQRTQIRRGVVDAFIEWEPLLRFLLDGRQVYEAGLVEFHDRQGGSLDLRRAFAIDDSPEEIGHFLAEAGFLHLEGVFTEAEMAEVSAELDAAIASAERDDGASWWACTEEGEWYPSRILGFNQKSEALRELLHSPRFNRIGTFTEDRFVQRDPDVGDSAEGLLKKVGVVEGISDVSWHKDCSIGGHSRHCCGLTVGISVTGAGRENGELGVVAGSHRANVSPIGVGDLDLPRLPLPTRTGDVTVHCSCTLHMSRPPVSAERRVVYTGFGLAPRAGEVRPQRSAAEVRRERSSLNDHVRRQQADHALGSRSASFDL
jgi:phytanoyl-CoA dioxygenase PhyH